MSVNMRPLGNNLVVEPIEDEEVSPGGIVLPDTAKEKPQRGMVLAVGPGLRLENGERQEMDVEEGDKVLFAKYGGTEIEEDDRTLMILSEDDILAILTD
ncbi:MAG: co-chaperone GroES [Chloroflexota bacterium]|nr:co-chaperone GroES [Chloroflexota bacterium]